MHCPAIADLYGRVGLAGESVQKHAKTRPARPIVRVGGIHDNFPNRSPLLSALRPRQLNIGIDAQRAARNEIDVLIVLSPRRFDCD
jgi:hypothetical protein